MSGGWRMIHENKEMEGKKQGKKEIKKIRIGEKKKRRD